MGATNVDDWTVLVGIAVPFIAAFIHRTDWPTDVKQWVSAAVALVVGALTVGFTGGFDGGITWEGWVGQLLAIYGAAQGVYVILRKPVKKIEVATTPAKRPRPPHPKG